VKKLSVRLCTIEPGWAAYETPLIRVNTKKQKNQNFFYGGRNAQSTKLLHPLSARGIFTQVLRSGSAAPDFGLQNIQAANFAAVAEIPADRPPPAARLNSLG
jgi:hypothetical protein